MENNFMFQADTFSHGTVSSFAEPERVRDLCRQALDLHRRNLLSEAETLYRRILDAEPNHPGALHFLGMIACAEKRFDTAVELIERSLQLCNTKAVYYNNYGVVLNELKRHDQARAAFEKAVTLNPKYAEGWFNLGMHLINTDGSPKDAERCLKKSIKFDSNAFHVRAELAELYYRTCRYRQACLQYAEILGHLPEDARTAHRLATIYGEAGDIEKSKHYFQIAATLPGGKKVWKWKHLWYCPTVFDNETQIDEYWENLNRDLDAALAEKPVYDWKTLAHEGFTHSFNLPHLNRCCKDVLEKFTTLFAPSFAHFERPNYRPGNKIKVGFLVTPGHEGGFLRLTSGIIEGLDPGKFEVFLIYNETTSKKFEGGFRRENLRHVRYSWDFERAVETIKDTKCDVIYYWKVGADTWNFFLPMCRLAPVQCTSWSTHGTSGVEHIDYYVSWNKAEIPDAQKHYTEKLRLLETTPLYEPIPKDLPPRASRAELGLPETGAIYFCPHRLAKYHPMFDDYLRQILSRDPTGHIVVLLGKDLVSGKRFIERMRRVIGETLFQRVIVLPYLGLHRFYRLMSVSTLALNSPVFTGGITTIDGFLLGLPCVTQTGEFMFQRHSGAYCETFDCPETIALNRGQYVDIAVELGTNKEFREGISRKIFEHHSCFFENAKTVLEWERFLLEAVGK